MSISLESTKDVVDIVSSVMASIGIGVGAVIAWRKWGKTAPMFERAVLSHEMIHHLLQPTHRLVHVSLEIQNAGQVTIEPVEVYTLIQRVTPLDESLARAFNLGKAPMDEDTKTEFGWPVLDRRDYPLKKGSLRIDSGESDRLESDFVIPAEVSAVFVYSCACLDPDNPDLGWDLTTFWDFTANPKL